MDFVLKDGDKKGIEGAAYIDKGDDGEFLLALCEGNYCEVRIDAGIFQPCGVGHMLQNSMSYTLCLTE
jgi:hypothetical protein